MSRNYPSAEEVREALSGLAARAELIVTDVNAATTLLAYADRFCGAPQTAGHADRCDADIAPTPAPTAFDVEAIYARRRAQIAGAQRRPA